MSTPPARPTLPGAPLILTLSLVASALTGCGVSGNGLSRTSSPSPFLRVTGSVHGGQQPIAGSAIALYAAGKTATASPARSMLSAPVVTDAIGNFSITGLYTCNPGDQVYLVASAGNAGAGNNPAIVLMAALGPCATLQANASSRFINIDEVTTVASVFSLAPFMSGPQNLGSGAPLANTLAAAFATVDTLADVSSGQALPAAPGNGIVPVATLNSLADSLANCVNSAPGSAACPNLFQAAQGSGATPSDTLQATLNIALNPSSNTSQIFLQASASPPFQPTLSAAPASYALVVQHPSDVLTYHNNAARTGVQPFETTLTPANVNPAHFGKLLTFSVDSFLYAQPLYVGGLGMPDGAVHNIVFAASTHATVYAFDADGNNPAAGFLWKQSFLPAGERFAAAADYGCSNPEESGIVGTPVIDRSSQTLYFVTKTITSSGATFFHRLHAVSLVDGSERPGSPALINPSFPGTGDGSSGSSIPFSGQHQNQRSALLLTPSSTGAPTVWIAYASHCDISPYHGLVLGYNTASMTLTSAFNDSPNGSEGGIWGNSGGPAADAQGNIIVLTGNGTFDATGSTPGPDYGDSAVKLTPATGTSTQMTVADSFTPSNQANLSATDADFGGTEPILFSDPASGIANNLLIASDKAGYLYLINLANMGRYDTGINGIDGKNGDLQDFNTHAGFLWSFAFFNNTLYVSNPLAAYTFVPGTASTAGHFNTTPIAQQTDVATLPVISANGTANAVLWTVDPGSAYLRAFTTPSLTLLYDSSSTSGRDTTPPFVKFTAPVIANGKLFLSGQGSLSVYGLLP